MVATGQPIERERGEEEDQLVRKGRIIASGFVRSVRQITAFRQAYRTFRQMEESRWPRPDARIRTPLREPAGILSLRAQEERVLTSVCAERTRSRGEYERQRPASAVSPGQHGRRMYFLMQRGPRRDARQAERAAPVVRRKRCAAQSSTDRTQAARARRALQARLADTSETLPAAKRRVDARQKCATPEPFSER